MKKITLFFVAIVLLNSHATVAQSSGEDTDNNALNPAAMLDQLDMSEISTGILIDRSFLFSNHAAFYKDSTGVANYSSWKQLYLEIFNAQLTPHHFPHLDTVKQKVNQELQKGFIPVLITDITYHQITPTAFQDSLLVMEDGVVKDVFPRTQSPYQTQRVINFTPSTDVIFQSEMTFLVSKQFFFSNQAEIPQTVEIDFDDGLGYRVVNWEATYTITYADIEDKVLKMRLTYNSESNTAYSILKQSSGCFECIIFNLTNPPDETGSIGGLVPAFGATGVIDYYIKSNAASGSSNFLDKPFIIVEGLDFEDTECNSRFKNGSVGWCTLWGQGGVPEFDLSPDLLNTLLAQGYDIIMIDYKDGATYIERNAFALVEFIKYLNNVRNAGPSVIVGTSMGGQVARYALSYMEKNNIQHCNRLYVSADSPHQGANIPMGIQEFLNFFSHKGPNVINDGFMDNLKNLNQPASKQLLVNHYTDVVPMIPTPNDAPQLHQNYFNSINQLGYPQKTRKIALSNGNRNGGSLPGMNPGDMALFWDFPNILNIGTCSGGNPLNTNFGAIFVKGRTDGIVFNGKVINNVGVNACFLLGPFCSSCVNNNSTSRIRKSFGLPFDNMPGGRRETYATIKDGIDASISFGGFNGSVNHEDHCFIPTKSGLDLNSSIGYFDNLATKQIIDRNNPDESLDFSPFEKLWAANGVNELHVELTPGNINWLIRETCAGEPNVGSMLTTTYNFARPENRFLYDVNIANGGNLLVNAQQLSDFGVATCVPAALPIPGPTFLLETSDCMSALEISNGGKMQIGDNTAGNAAKVIIHSGVEVTLRTGSKLFIHNNSTLIIEKGAKLIYEPGAIIQLLGDEAVLEIQGELEVKDHATFTFTFPNNNSGYLKFNVPFNPCQSNPNWACPVISAGHNTRMELIGANKNDKILEIAGEDMLIPQEMAFFQLWKGKAEFTTPGARLSLGSTRYQLNDATLVGTVNNRGVVVWGNPNSFIVRCDFESVGIRGELYMAGNRLIVLNSNFTNGGFVTTIGRGVLFNDVDFSNVMNVPILNPLAINGWFGLQTDMPSFYTKGKIDNGGINTSTNSSIHLNEVKIKEGGIIHEGGILSMKCSEITNSPTNLVSDGILSAASQIRMSSIDGNGFNKITGSCNNIASFDTDLIDIELGFNDFSEGILAVEFPQFNAPAVILGNGNQYFAGAGMGAGTPDPNTTSEFTQPPYSGYYTNFKKAMFYEKSSACNGAITASNCVKIPVQWQFLPNQLPTAPCAVAGGGGGGGGVIINNPTGSVSPLVSCATCPVVNSATFSGQPLNQAILNALSFMELVDSTKNDFTALQLFHEIFTTTPINFNDPDQAFLVKYAYANMKDALQYCFVTGRLTNGDNVPTLHTSVNQFMDVLHLRQQPVTAQNVSEQFFLALDEALIYRLIGQRDEAITRMEAIDNCFLTERHRQILKTTIAATKVERDVINGTVPLMAAIDLMDAVPRIEIKSNTSTIDTTATIHPTASIGANVTIGSNVVIAQHVIIGANAVIENNVTLKQSSSIGENTTIKANTLIEKEVQIGNHTTIGSFNEIKKNTTIGNHTVLGDSVLTEKEVTVYDYVEIANSVVIKKETALGNGAFIGAGTEIGKEITIGELSIVRENSTIEDKVKLGNRNILAKNVQVKNKTKTGKAVLVEENKVIPPNKIICDNADVSGNFNFNTTNCPIALPVLDNGTNTCAFAMGYAQTRTNFLNGFTLTNQQPLLTNQPIAFKPDHLASFYAWNFGDCSISTNETPTHIFIQPGIYLITLTLGTSCDTITYFGAITVFPNPTSVIEPLPVACANTAPIGVGRTTNIAIGIPSCVSTSDCPTFIPINRANCRLHFVWEFEADTAKIEQMIGLNDSTLVADTLFNSLTASGTFQVALTTTVEAREQTEFTFEDVARTDTANTTIDATTRFDINIAFEGCAQNGVQFISTLTGGGSAPFSYSWNFGNGTTSTQVSPFVNGLDTGLLAVTLTVTDAANCSNQITTTVFIPDCNANARMNGAEMEEANPNVATSIKIPITEENTIKAYPNPTTGKVIFEYSLGEFQANLVITDLMGRVVHTTVLNGNNKTTVNLSNYPKGIYLYKVIGSAKIMKSDKLILME